MEETKEVEAPKQFINSKIFLIGLPLFILQLVVVYFVTANILLTKIGNSSDKETVKNEKTQPLVTVEPASKDTVELGKNVYTIDDIIINPAGTAGQRLMLISIGFDVKNGEQLKLLGDKNVMLKDMIITTLSNKSISRLSEFGYKDSLKAELAANLNNLLPSVGLNSIYFSKYIIQ